MNECVADIGDRGSGGSIQGPRDLAEAEKRLPHQFVGPALLASDFVFFDVIFVGVDVLSHTVIPVDRPSKPPLRSDISIRRDLDHCVVTDSD